MLLLCEHAHLLIFARRARVRWSAHAFISAAAILVLFLLAPAATLAGTVLNTAGCSSPNALFFGSLSGVGASITSDDCTIQFGSDDSASMLHVWQRDGAGSALHRTSSGKLDPSFDTDGILSENKTSGIDEYRGVAVQEDGKIVVLGTVDEAGILDMYVRRYLPNGNLDPSFATGGELAMPGSYSARDLFLSPDGSIFVVGYGADRVQVGKITPDGRLDPTWNGGTWTNHLFQAAIGTGVAATNLTVDSSGRVVVGGYTGIRGTDDLFAARYLPNGQLDASFSVDGFQVIDVGLDDRGYGVAVQTDGKVLVAGYSGALAQMAIIRLNADGELDTSFNSTGIYTASVGTGASYLRQIEVRPNGKILATGYARQTGSDYDPLMLQLT